MQRRQIYLTSREAAALDAAARQTGHTRSHMIRAAIEAVYLAVTDTDDRLRALEASAGIWADRAESGQEAIERLRPGRLGKLHARIATDRWDAMALVVVDTCVLIDHLRGHPGAVESLRSAVERGNELWSVSIVRTELLAGARPNEAERTLALLGALRWLDFTVDVADAAGVLAARYLRSHPGVDTVDNVIAAATLALGATLLTQNVRHFPMFPDLARASD